MIRDGSHRVACLAGELWNHVEKASISTYLLAGDMALVSNFIAENANMARDRCSAICAALMLSVPALTALPDFTQQVPSSYCHLSQSCRWGHCNSAEALLLGPKQISK